MSNLLRLTQTPRACASLLVALSILSLSLVAREAQAQFGNGFFGNRVGGVMVNPEGALVSLDDRDRIAARDFFKKMHAPPVGELNQHVELRKFSLRKLEEAIRQANKPVVEELPDELRFLGGIQRLQYVLVYPEEHDVVLAGPGEGWKVAEDGNVVGVTTGRPVLRLEDLLVALRSVENARRGGITCSIDPTAEGRQRMDALVAQRLNYSSNLLTAIKAALGPQKITITGVPADSHFARVLVSSDFYMKQIAM